MRRWANRVTGWLFGLWLLPGCTRAPDADSATISGGLNRIRTANQLADKAASALSTHHYTAAIRAYEQMSELAPLPEEARLNLAHAYFRARRPAEARAAYAPLTGSADPARRAVALHQLGLLAAADRDYDRALSLLRTALRTAPSAPAVRASYETLVRWLAAGARDEEGVPPPGGLGGPPREQPRPTGRQQRPADQRPGGPGDAPRGAGNQPGGGDRPTESGTREESLAQGGQTGGQRGLGPGGSGASLPPADAGASANPAGAGARRTQTLRPPQPDATIPAAQARMLLEAMQAAETQYLQQIPRGARKPTEPTRPDW